MIRSGSCQDSSPHSQERENEMRRKRFVRGCLAARKRRNRKYWYAQWSENGERRCKELGLCSEMNRAEAAAILADILRPINAAIGRASENREVYTFERFCHLVYLPVYQRKWKVSTCETETDRIEFHLVAELGPRLMQEITREELQKLLDRKAKDKSQSLVDHLRFRLRSMFELAMSEGIVERNPAVALYTPRDCKPGRVKHVLTPADLGKILDALNLREQVVVRLATYEGMRPGEILALKPQDVHDSFVSVSRRVYKGNIDLPKTKRSVRQVALTLGTARLLQEWKELIITVTDGEWLFPSENGTPLRRDSLWRWYLGPKLTSLGLEWANFQVMRRTFATLSKKAGVDAHTRAAQMGNTVDVNENEYAVATFEEKLAAVRKFESVVAPATAQEDLEEEND
jgi:integrase